MQIMGPSLRMRFIIERGFASKGVVDAAGGPVTH
jgi:hypothetical protein